ncbi:hypothetical protein ACB094_05G113100 [Castanea mollissima]
MEWKIMSLGSSILVPCVQELAKETSSTVPPHYMHFPYEPPIKPDTTSLPQVPVIDMQRLFSTKFRDSELDELHHASKEWGYFQLINHGVDTSLMEKVKKKKLWRLPGKLEEFGQAFVVSDEQKLDWGDMFYISMLPIHLRNLFLKIPLPFRDNLDAYSVEVRDIAKKILELMAKALRMEHNDMRNLFEEGYHGMRMNYYPPCP